MDARINQLTVSFKIMTGLKEETGVMMVDLVKKITKLKEIYSEFVKNNKQSVFIFGLDSFHFQGKLIDIEYEDMNRLFLAITNRMYCEYFKLYRIIMEYISKTINDAKILDTLKINNNYPIYKDLEPFKVYPFEIIHNIHDTIVTLLHSINGCIVNKEEELEGYRLKNNMGINIDNFVHTFNYNIIMMREKMVLFITYMEFFHKLHNKYLKRFTTKLHLMTNQINNDIKFDNIDQPKTTDVEEEEKDAVKDDNVVLNIESLPEDNVIITENEIVVEEKEKEDENVLEEKEEKEEIIEPIKEEEKKETHSQMKEESVQTIKIKRAYKPRKQTKG